MKEKNKIKKVVKSLINVLSENKITRPNLIVDTLALLLYSVGSSLEECEIDNSEEILIRYGENPTLGNALMAQAKQMKETWIVTERE